MSVKQSLEDQGFYININHEINHVADALVLKHVPKTMFCKIYADRSHFERILKKLESALGKNFNEDYAGLRYFVVLPLDLEKKK